MLSTDWIIAFPGMGGRRLDGWLGCIEAGSARSLETTEQIRSGQVRADQVRSGQIRPDGFLEKVLGSMRYATCRVRALGIDVCLYVEKGKSGTMASGWIDRGTGPGLEEISLQMNRLDSYLLE